jgi:hypothetical protein
LSDLFETSTERRRRHASEAESATISQLHMDVAGIKRSTGLAYKIAAAIGTVILSGAGGTALHFMSRAEQIAEARGAERIRLDRAERSVERLEREVAELRALFTSLFPTIRNWPTHAPAPGDDR